MRKNKEEEFHYSFFYFYLHYISLLVLGFPHLLSFVFYLY